jgi:hypothetical protein
VPHAIFEGGHGPQAVEAIQLDLQSPRDRHPSRTRPGVSVYLGEYFITRSDPETFKVQWTLAPSTATPPGTPWPESMVVTTPPPFGTAVMEKLLVVEADLPQGRIRKRAMGRGPRIGSAMFASEAFERRAVASCPQRLRETHVAPNAARRTSQARGHRCTHLVIGSREIGELEIGRVIGRPDSYDALERGLGLGVVVYGGAATP